MSIFKNSNDKNVNIKVSARFVTHCEMIIRTWNCGKRIDNNNFLNVVFVQSMFTYEFLIYVNVDKKLFVYCSIWVLIYSIST